MVSVRLGPRDGYDRLGAVTENEMHRECPGCYDRAVATDVGRGLGTWVGAIADRPAVATAAGALGVSTSGLFVAISSTSPGTASFLRCVFGLPLLVPLAVAEWRHRGAPTRRGCARTSWSTRFALGWPKQD